ncbi:MAG TPA: LCP family protein, partial [Solirubrobacterales bacterium]|nr:LCP family protein [Solirubrobacterales bacterium]
MSSDGEQRPPQPPESPPEYKVYRSRRGLFSRLKGGNLSGLRDRARLPSWPRRKRDEPGAPPPERGRVTPGRVLKWVGLAALAWILISFVAFGVSAQIQSFKLSGEAGKALHGNPFLLPSAQTILVLGTDARPPDTNEPGAPHKKKCFEQQSHGDAPHDGCEAGEYRADTLMLIRAGGGTFRKLSIPRDTYAEIPGNAPTKINAAFAYGGAALQIKT